MSAIWLVRGLVAAVGLALLVWGVRRQHTQGLIAGAMLVGVPWVFSDAGKLVGFAGGIVATLWVILRLQKD